MNREGEPQLDISFTYLFPMRTDNPAFADFNSLREEITEVMEKDYPAILVSRISSMLAGNGLSGRRTGVEFHNAKQESGLPGSVKAVTFNAPLNGERIKHKGLRIGEQRACALVEFAIRLQQQCEAGELPQRAEPTSRG